MFFKEVYQVVSCVAKLSRPTARLWRAVKPLAALQFTYTTPRKAMDKTDGVKYY